MTDTPRVTVPVKFGDETAEQIVRRWASWINDVSADMDEPEWGGKTHNDVLNERDFLIRALSAPPAPARDELLEALGVIARSADDFPKTDGVGEAQAYRYGLEANAFRARRAIAKHKGPQS